MVTLGTSKIYAIIGPPASGKTAVIKALAPHGVAELISHTTRKPKPGEQHGVHYHFVSSDDFLKTDLVERVTYDDHFYGLSKAEIQHKTGPGKPAVVAVDQRGLDQLRRVLGDRVRSIFLLVDEETILDRAILAGDPPEVLRHRLDYAKAAGEFDNWRQSDFVVKNTATLDLAVNQILAIIGLLAPPPPGEPLPAENTPSEE